MNILQEYTLDFVKRNRRSSIAIMVALLLTVTMLSGLSGFFWTMYTDNIRLELKESGNWHGELFDDTYGRDLEQIENYASVEAVMVKGPWKVSRLESGNPRRQYLRRGPRSKRRFFGKRNLPADRNRFLYGGGKVGHRHILYGACLHRLGVSGKFRCSAG